MDVVLFLPVNQGNRGKIGVVTLVALHVSRKHHHRSRVSERILVSRLHMPDYAIASVSPNNVPMTKLHMTQLLVSCIGTFRVVLSACTLGLLLVSCMTPFRSLL